MFAVPMNASFPCLLGIGASELSMLASMEGRETGRMIMG